MGDLKFDSSGNPVMLILTKEEMKTGIMDSFKKQTGFTVGNVLKPKEERNTKMENPLPMTLFP